ncbi:hypothetical protein BO82DRAFT_42165 [Aspergillus uvarum CBS 121591]|uniref:Uncharacterized protein n=1 Tax=Aspergillus uvarum CBS 121591 TaxID=1448315 RepID=A0A319CI68_9EURO|nr:hypothetical protein BO82DRAFT_42165 [Aspergillus uvarum CBS 121591]PYH83491.1 hypothetical protein BO82DRAFT_42165 [Aspergillus uvarum CBS 121591]
MGLRFLGRSLALLVRLCNNSQQGRLEASPPYKVKGLQGHYRLHAQNHIRIQMKSYRLLTFVLSAQADLLTSLMEMRARSSHIITCVF